MAIVLAALCFSLVSCSNDEPDSEKNSTFTFNGEKMYAGTADNNMPELIYSRKSEQMQISISLYKSKNDIYPSVSGDIEIETFDPSTQTKGKGLDIIPSKFTCIEEQTGNSFPSTNVNRYYKNITGSITFEGYNASKNIVTLKFNNVKLESQNSQSTILNGTLSCEYDDDGYLTQYSGIW